MNWMFYAAQIIGVLTTVIVVVAAQLKNMKLILLCQLCANLMVAISSGMLGGLSGAWLCSVAAVQTVMFYFLDKRGMSPKTRKWVLWLFAAVYVIGTILVYRNWGDIVSCAGVLLYLLAITQSQSSKYRRYMCLNTLLWIIYDITILAFGSMIAHGVEFTSALIGIFRLDIGKNIRLGRMHLIKICPGK